MNSLKDWKIKSTETISLLKKIRHHIRAIVPNAEIVLYGSRVRGTAEKESDWDLLILIDQKVERNLEDKLRDSIYDVELETAEILSCIIRSKEEWNSPRYSVLPFKRNVEKEGVLL